MSKSIKILIADDEPDIVQLVSYNLAKEGYMIIEAFDGEEALALAKEHHPDLIILDVMMPKMDGIEVCKELRSYADFKDTIITFLTARNEDYTQIAGFDSGGDDYIQKPISPRVLVSRIKALLKRKSTQSGAFEVQEFGDLRISPVEMLVYVKGESIELTKKEFNILKLLTTLPGKVFSREEIFSNVWGDDLIVGDRTIDVHIRKIREKIGEQYILTMKGVGYKFSH